MSTLAAWSLAALVVSAVGCAAVFVYDLLTSSTAPVDEPGDTELPTCCVPSPEAAATHAVTPQVTTDHKGVQPRDLMGIRVLCARQHPGDRDAAAAMYDRILDGLAAAEAASLDDELRALVGGA